VIARAARFGIGAAPTRLPPVRFPGPRFRSVTALRWKLARLSAMSAGEAAHRARVALRDRFAPPAYASWTPARAAERLFEGGAASALSESLLPRWGRALEPAQDFAPAVTTARALLEGRWSLFGHDVRLEDPPRWRRNHVTGAEWPDAASVTLDYRRGDIAGGARLAWELGRLTMLPTLALASPRSPAERHTV